MSFVILGIVTGTAAWIYWGEFAARMCRHIDRVRAHRFEGERLRVVFFAGNWRLAIQLEVDFVM